MDLLRKKEKATEKREIAQVFMDGFGKEGLDTPKYIRELNIFMASIAINNPARLIDRLSAIQKTIKFAKSIGEDTIDYKWDELIKIADENNILTLSPNVLVISEKAKKFMKTKSAEVESMK